MLPKILEFWNFQVLVATFLAICPLVCQLLEMGIALLHLLKAGSKQKEFVEGLGIPRKEYELGRTLEVKTNQTIYST